MKTLAYPFVPSGPLAKNDRVFAVELKVSSDMVEFETTEKTYCSNGRDTDRHVCEAGTGTSSVLS